MSKQKSHSGAKKRVRLTGSGKVAVKRRGRSHLLQQKSKRQKRLSRTLVVDGVDRKTLTSLLPYLS
ncbi:MAG: 50S ribosomal protein L35 [Candidatus Peribacteraceae bacterium]|nr:50S ribosomal protein L35 [Candidatus Peribacteraceae bacterium]MDD5075382.1 50S ribosomal protein L35 [Candidatus Peribacteraceae bacterium]